MKIFYTILISTLFGIGTQAQNFSLTFEDTNVINQVFYTDSILDPIGIWQIGMPHKSFMNSSLTQPNAIVTFTDSLLPANTKASFIITLNNVQLNPQQGGFFTFAHRYEFDSAHGGGYVEFSVDTGRHWHGVFQDSVRLSCQSPNLFNRLMDTVDGQIIPIPTWWDNIRKDTTASGVLYFTGTDSVWAIDTIVFPAFVFAVKTSVLTQFMFRFTAFTDSLSLPLGGWLIDNINFSNTHIGCGGGINEINSAHLHVYPDPATDEFFVSLLNEPESDYEFILYDLSGRVVIRTRFTGQEITMRRDGIDAGSYFIQLIDQRTQNTFQKRIVFE